jgi:flavodoxin
VKALVLYRSFNGNTRQLAAAIGRRLGTLGYEAAIQDVRARLPDLGQVDIVLNGAPTRMARVNRRSVSILRKLKAKGLANKPVAIFDTCALFPNDPAEREKAKSWIEPGAAGIMQTAARELGLNVYKDTLRCPVRAIRGPLVDDAEQKAGAFVEAFVASAWK